MQREKAHLDRDSERHIYEAGMKSLADRVDKLRLRLRHDACEHELGVEGDIALGLKRQDGGHRPHTARSTRRSVRVGGHDPWRKIAPGFAGPRWARRDQRRGGTAPPLPWGFG